MAFTKANLATMNAKMVSSGNLLILNEIDKTNPDAWTYSADPIFVDNKIEKNDLKGSLQAKNLTLTVDHLINNESFAALLNDYTVTTTATEAKEYTLEDGETESVSASSSDTSKILLVHAIFGTADGKRQSFCGTVQLTENTGSISTVGSDVIRRGFELKWVEAPATITLPGRTSNVWYPNIADDTDPACWTKKRYNSSATGDSTRLPVKTSLVKGDYGYEMWLDAE